MSHTTQLLLLLLCQLLQVMSVADISRPSYASSGSSRLLLLKLNDGRVTCKALEHKTCSQLADTLLPGTKVSSRQQQQQQQHIT
jgi:hypothetical protein